MTRRRFLLISVSVLAACLSGPVLVTGARAGAESLPSGLPDREFWKIIADFSEPNGSFRSDNLLSNEPYFQHVIPELVRTAKAGRVYMGVGPEQNFTYIAALKPKMVFIVDIRRGNLDLQLMYKALFELSADRAEFVGRLFARKRPQGLDGGSAVENIFAKYAEVEASESLYKENLDAIYQHLTAKRGMELSADDRGGIEYVYRAFVEFGPDLRYSSTGSFGGRFQPSYADLMMAKDGSGHSLSYLSSEDTFGVLKDLEANNLVVPLVGDFGGPKAIRAVAKYLHENGATVSAFYLSNVEQYLFQDGKFRDFCANVVALPLDDTSTFIRSTRGRGYDPRVGLSSELGKMQEDLESCLHVR